MNYKPNNRIRQLKYGAISPPKAAGTKQPCGCAEKNDPKAAMEMIAAVATESALIMEER